jgi:DNA-binding NarL/FixJ family response regulator
MRTSAESREARPRAAGELDRGRLALAQGRWRDARRGFEAALRQGDAAEAYEGLGLAAWWLDAAATVFASRQHAYRIYVERGEREDAARVAVWLAWDHLSFRGERSLAGGWLRRAHRMLEGTGVSVERAWLAAREGSIALDDGDLAAALTHARTAVRSAAKAGAVDHELVGRALEGVTRVTQGNVTAGMARLDEVVAAILAGEASDRISIALAVCHAIHACELARDSARAGEWCDSLRAWAKSWRLRPLLATCRTRYASVCIWRGDWGEAERELRAANQEFAASRPAMAAEGLVRLAELRRQQGRREEAAQLYDEAEPHPLAALGRAALLLEEGHSRRAADLAERCLRRLAGKHRIERAPALELLVRARLDLGQRAAALAAAGELTRIAERVGAPAVRASAHLANGLIAADGGDLDRARRLLEDAIDAFQSSGAPLEAARAGLELARLEAAERRDSAIDDARRAVALLESLSAPGELERGRALLLSLQAEAAPPAASNGLSRRELEILRLVSDGLSNAAVGERLHISSHTVHRHVANIFDKLGVSSRAAAVAQGAKLRLLAAD